MAQLSAKLRSVESGMVAFWCPGCDHAHTIRVNSTDRPNWSWDGNADAPTFAPSILVTIDWPEEDGGKEVCHSFVRAGRIEFLSDCTHSLSGKTVDLPDFPGNVAGMVRSD